jgi:hypothetical protein
VKPYRLIFKGLPMFHRLWALAAAGLLLGSTGCGKGISNVSGKVSLEGKPVLFGTVEMVGDDNRLHQAVIQPDGSYTIEGVPYGQVRVMVQSPDPVAVFTPPVNLGPERTKLLPPRPKIDNKGWFAIPEDYGFAGKSGLSLTVEQANTTYNIELKAKSP